MRHGPLRVARHVTPSPAWWKPIKSGEFREYYEKQYRARLEEAR